MTFPESRKQIRYATLALAVVLLVGMAACQSMLSTPIGKIIAEPRVSGNLKVAKTWSLETVGSSFCSFSSRTIHPKILPSVFFRFLNHFLP